jgi:L-threonylcarbamoyladenylate synthase
MKMLGLDEAVEMLRAGKVIIYPTETSYALGCDATNDKALQRVFTIKGREDGKGTPIILPPDSDPAAFIEFSEMLKAIADQHWPGALNVVSERKSTSSVSRHAETNGSQSVRKSSHPLAFALAEGLGRPIVATSANRSGEPSLYKVQEILEAFSSGEVPDGFLSGGDLEERPASTIITLRNGEIKVLRQGQIIL